MLICYCGEYRHCAGRNLSGVYSGGYEMSMPILPVDEMCADLGEYDEKLIRAAFNRTTGKLRTTKPFRRFDVSADDALFKACANYVWRMLCFDFVDLRPHSCLPVSADWDVRLVLRERGACDGESTRQALDDLIKQVESVMPATAQAGVLRWAGLV
jgi:hypothetical protein